MILRSWKSFAATRLSSGLAEELLADGSRHVVFRPPASRAARPAALFEVEAAGAQVSGKTLSFKGDGLTRLVLRPAIKGGVPKNLRRALLLTRDRVPRVSPSIVGIDRRAEMGIVIAVAVHRDRKRQAHADVTRACRIANAQPRYREHLVGEAEYCRDRIGVVAQGADWATAETHGLGRQDKGLHNQCGIDGGVEEPFEA